MRATYCYRGDKVWPAVCHGRYVRYAVHPALHVVERYRLIDYEAAKEAQERNGKENWRFNAAIAEGWVPDPTYKGKGLQLQFMVEDEGVFTTPWSATITYRRPSLTQRGENVCAENIHEYYAGKDTAVPRAETPDF